MFRKLPLKLMGPNVKQKSNTSSGQDVLGYASLDIKSQLIELFLLKTIKKPTQWATMLPLWILTEALNVY